MTEAERLPFLARIAEAPGDLSRRLVFGDWLQERGEAWGELIAIQCSAIARGVPLTDDEDARVAEILRVYGREILGSIAPHVDVKSVVFEKGMPVAGRFRRGSAPVPFDHPLWATFEALRVLATDDATLLKLLGTSKTLRPKTLGVYPHQFVAIERDARAPLAIEALELSGWGTEAMRPYLQEMTRFPSLRALSIAQAVVDDVIIAFLEAAPVVRRLARFDFQPYGWRAGALVRDEGRTIFEARGFGYVQTEDVERFARIVARSPFAVTEIRLVLPRPLEGRTREPIERVAESVGAALTMIESAELTNG